MKLRLEYSYCFSYGRRTGAKAVTHVSHTCPKPWVPSPTPKRVLKSQHSGSRQKDHKFKATFIHLVNLRPACFKTKTEINKQGEGFSEETTKESYRIAGTLAVW